MERRRSKLLPSKRKWNRTAKVEVVQTAERSPCHFVQDLQGGERRQQSFNINAIYSSNFAFYGTNTHIHTHTRTPHLEQSSSWQATGRTLRKFHKKLQISPVPLNAPVCPRRLSRNIVYLRGSSSYNIGLSDMQ